MIKKIHSITLSLAGICQSVYLLQKLAYSGQCDHFAFKTCLESTLEINPTSVIAIYGNHEKNLNLGLKILISILTFSSISHSYVEFVKYVFNMIILEKKININHTTIYSLKKKLSIISREYYAHHDIDFLINNLGNLYFEIISPLGSRISVKGTKMFLQDSEIQKKIRCLLLSGIRSIVLWKQFGGNALKLIFFRCSIVKKAKKILYT